MSLFKHSDEAMEEMLKKILDVIPVAGSGISSTEIASSLGVTIPTIRGYLMVLIDRNKVIYEGRSRSRRY